MSGNPPATTQEPLTGGRRVLGCICVGLFFLLYIGPMTWDLIAWTIGGNAFLRSPRFHSLEGRSVSLGGTGLMIGFFGIDRGLELIKQGRVVAFLIAFLSVTGAALPSAPELNILSRSLIIKGPAVVTHPRFIELSLLTLLLLACKCRALTQFFRPMRPDLVRLFKPRTTRFVISSVENTP